MYPSIVSINDLKKSNTKSTLQFIRLGVFLIVGTIKKQVMDFGLRHTRSNPPTSFAYSKSDMFLLVKKLSGGILNKL